VESTALPRHGSPALLVAFPRPRGGPRGLTLRPNPKNRRADLMEAW